MIVRPATLRARLGNAATQNAATRNAAIRNAAAGGESAAAPPRLGNARV